MTDVAQILMHYFHFLLLSPSAMDKSDLLVHVQKLSMKLEEERAKVTEGVAKMRRRVSVDRKLMNEFALVLRVMFITTQPLEG